MTSAPPPPCRRCSNCAHPVGIPLPLPLRSSVFAPDRPPWMSQLAETNFSEACVADRACTTCGGAAFCEHCCGEHHRGHDTSPAAVANGHPAAEARRRDSFCTACRVAFCSELCAHHNEGHEVIPVDEYGPWYCARCTGSEGWFPCLFDGVRAFRDEQGNVLLPLHWRSSAPACPSWFLQLLTADFSETCATDHVCNTCGGAGFCGHCCGEHHRGHDTAAAAASDREPSFCIGCRVAFCSDLCAHHAAGGGSEGHEVIPIEEHDSWYCARCTGTERWFSAVSGRAPALLKDKDGSTLAPIQVKRAPLPEVVQAGDVCPPWMYHLVALNFSMTCARDSVCNTCDGGGAAFCGHCCGEHHRGHDTAPASTATKKKDGSTASETHQRDSFCTGCLVNFCSDLCAHHAGHEVIPIDAYSDRHFVRSTGGSEPWFTDHAFGGIETFEDKDGNLMVPLERKRSRLPEPGLKYRYDGGATTPLAA